MLSARIIFNLVKVFYKKDNFLFVDQTTLLLKIQTSFVRTVHNIINFLFNSFISFSCDESWWLVWHPRALSSVVGLVRVS